jgi:hypothetical protein
MYAELMVAVAIIRTKMTCKAWNFVSKPVSRRRVVMAIYKQQYMVSWDALLDD